MDKQFYREELGNMIAENSKLKKQILELIMENAELKDMVLDNGGDYTETDGYDLREIGGDDLLSLIHI